MKNEALYHKTVDILFQAYLNDTLKYTESCGCAVGNLVAANNNFEIIKRGGRMIWLLPNGNFQDVADWTSVHLNGEPSFGYTKDRRNKGFKEINSTGYNWLQTMQIEMAFSNGRHKYCYTNPSEEERNFNGLMAVIKVLDIIHENNDTQVTADSKKRFDKSCAVTVTS